MNDSEVGGRARSRSRRWALREAIAVLALVAGCDEQIGADRGSSASEVARAAQQSNESPTYSAEITLTQEVRAGQLTVESLSSALALNGEDRLLYAEAYVDEIGSDGTEEVAYSASYRTPELRSTVVPPLEVPEAAWENELEQDVTGVLVRFQAGEQDSDMVTVQALIARGRRVARIDAPPTSSADEIWREQIRQVQTGELSSLRRENGHHLVTVLFEPRMRPDAVARGDWFGPRDSRITAELIREQGAREGREIVTAASSSSAALFGAETGCSVVRTLGFAHGARFSCSDDELTRFVDVTATDIAALEFNHEVVLTDMAGDDFRADTGTQLRLMLTRDDSNTLCHNSGGTRECHDGRQGGNGSSMNVRVALIDSQGFFRAEDLPSLDDTRGGASRVQQRYTCDDTSCAVDTTDGGEPASHGAGSVLPAFQHTLQEQDTDGSGCHPSSYDCGETETEQENQSKGSYEADLYLYQTDNGSAGIVEAIDHATDPAGAVDADMVVMSLAGQSGSRESAPSTFSALAAVWDAAIEDADALPVISADNFINRFNDDCTANQYATRDDIVVVGAFGDGNDPTLFTYDTESLMNFEGAVIANATNCAGTDNMCSRSAVGGADLRVNGATRNAARAVIDVASISGSRYYQRWNDSATGFVWQPKSCCSTSMGTPLAASAYTSFVDFVYSNGLTGAMHPTRLQAALLLMADGESGSEVGGAAPTTDYSGMDDSWGAGRLLMRRFDDVGTNAPWTWGIRADWAYDNDILAFRASSAPMNSDVDEFVAVIVWNEPYRNPAVTTDAADIELEIITTAPSGGTCPVTPTGTTTLVAEDIGYDTHKIVRIQSNGGAAFDGKCLYTLIHALEVPSPMDGYYRRRVVTTTFFEDRDNEPSDLAANIE